MFGCQYLFITFPKNFLFDIVLSELIIVLILTSFTYIFFVLDRRRPGEKGRYHSTAELRNIIV